MLRGTLNACRHFFAVSSLATIAGVPRYFSVNDCADVLAAGAGYGVPSLSISATNRDETAVALARIRR
jgi:hypothetical protein